MAFVVAKLIPIKFFNLMNLLSNFDSVFSKMGFGQSLKPGVGVGMKIEFVSLKAVLHDGVGVAIGPVLR